MSKKKRKATKKRAINRPYCGGTMTSSQFFGFIRAALRNKFTRWAPKYAALKEAQRPYKGSDKRTKWLYECAITGKLFKQSEVEVDHVTPCGSLRCFEDLPEFTRRLFCEKEGLQVVSKEAHKAKTAAERKKK